MGKEDAGLENLAREAFELEREVSLPIPKTEFTPREPRIITERCNITQGKICMGFRTGTANTGVDVYKLMLMNELLGGSAGSRLFTNVREKENLCYYINSFVYRAKAIVFVQSGVDGRNFSRVTELVEQQIAGLSAGNISDTEVSGAKKSLTRRIRAMLDSQAACIDFHMSQHMLRDQCDVQCTIEQLERLVKDDVCEMAAKMRLDTIFRLEAGERDEYAGF
jgi:predicted Zn-dependent peptidase